MNLQLLADGYRWKEQDWSDLDRREKERWNSSESTKPRKTQKELWEERQAKINARSSGNT